MRGPQNGPQYVLILIIKTPKKGSLIVGNHHSSRKQEASGDSLESRILPTSKLPFQMLWP